MRYFRILYDPAVRERWHPTQLVGSDGSSADPRILTSCQRYEGPSLSFAKSNAGPEFPFTFGPFDLPLAHPRLANKLETAASGDVQVVEVGTDQGPRAALNVLRCVSAIDEQRTVGEKWQEHDGRSDKVGQYRTIVALFIDPLAAEGVHLFRLTGWRAPLIASEFIMSEFDADDLRGRRLLQVS